MRQRPVDKAAVRLHCAVGEPQQTLVAHSLAEVRPLLDAVDALARLPGFSCTTQRWRDLRQIRMS